MTTSGFTFDREAIIRAVRPFISDHRGEGRAVSLADLLNRLRDSITVPEGVYFHCEQSRCKGADRLRLILSNLDEDLSIGVTRRFRLREIIDGPETPESIALAIERIIARANKLLPALRALKLGIDRIEHEIDYRDPKHLITLLEDRGCTVLNLQAVARLVDEEPGPLYYGDIDLCEDGADWALSGGPWADRLEGKLVELGAVRREDERAV